jgi:hypothetical protein
MAVGTLLTAIKISPKRSGFRGRGLGRTVSGVTVRAMAARLLLHAGIAALVGLATTACGDPPRKTEPKAQTLAVPARGTDRPPAAAAGGACQLLDFFAVEQLIGVQFEIAASGQRDTTATCVLQKSGVGYPDLTLAVTPTTVAAAGFKAAVPPPGAADVPGLGLAAYRIVLPAPGPAASGPAASGPAVEIGWLSRNSQLMLVRYRLAADRPQSEADALVTRVTDLATFLDPA